MVFDDWRGVVKHLCLMKEYAWVVEGKSQLWWDFDANTSMIDVYN